MSVDDRGTAYGRLMVRFRADEDRRVARIADGMLGRLGYVGAVESAGRRLRSLPAGRGYVRMRRFWSGALGYIHGRAPLR